MSPAALLDYDRSRLRGLVLEEARRREPRRDRRPRARHAGRQRHRRTSPRSSSTATRSSSTAMTGEVYLRPPADVEAAYAEKARMRARRQAQYRALRDVPDRHRATASGSGCT